MLPVSTHAYPQAHADVDRLCQSLKRPPFLRCKPVNSIVCYSCPPGTCIDTACISPWPSSQGQLYTGTWVEGTAKCGELEDLQRQNAENPTQYPIPELKLADPETVLKQAKEAQFEGKEPDFDY